MRTITLVLAVGQDPTLLDTRNAILRAAGYMVAPALSVQEAIDQFRAGDFDLVLLCHSMHPDDRHRLACLVRASGSQTPVVFVAALSVDAFDSFADATVTSEPRELLRGIHEVLLKTEKTRYLDRADGSAAPGPRRGILCVDDDPNLLVARRKLLEDAGYLVLTAQAASQGLTVFSTGIVDLVILDYAVPTMNGGVLAALMRQTNRKIPLILNSALSPIPSEALALFDRVVPKGLPPSALLSAIAECCPDRGPTGQKPCAFSSGNKSDTIPPARPEADSERTEG